MAKSFSLPAGSYTVVPSTYSPGARGEFYLRVFTQSSRAESEAESGLRPGSTEHIIGSEDEDKNTAVIEEELVPQQEQKDETKESRVNIKRKPREENRIIRIKTEYTEITIRLVERQK